MPAQQAPTIPPAPTAAAVAAQPFLRWVGGKRKLVKTLLERIHVPPNARYYEPFLGAGALFFGLFERGDFRGRPEPYLNDINEELMLTWTAIQHDLPAVVVILKELAQEFCKHGENVYYQVRATKPPPANTAARAARMLFLNRLCFNGVYRVNKAGEFNVPLGKFATAPTVESIVGAAGLQAAHRVLRTVNPVLSSESFEVWLRGARSGDVVYFDPPYAPVSQTANFTAYSKRGFDAIDQAALHDVALDLVNRGVRVLISNSDVPLTRALYERPGNPKPAWRVERIQVGRGINSDTTKRGKVSELLISGGA